MALLLVCLSGCGRGVVKHWEDGEYVVYTRPASRDIIMGHREGDGGILGLSAPAVISAGADARYVVFSRQTVSGGIEHYYIERKPAEAGDILGPFSPSDYQSVAARLSLPAFRWHLKQP